MAENAFDFTSKLDISKTIIQEAYFMLDENTCEMINKWEIDHVFVIDTHYKIVHPEGGVRAGLTLLRLKHIL